MMPVDGILFKSKEILPDMSSLLDYKVTPVVVFSESHVLKHPLHDSLLLVNQVFIHR